MVGERFESNQCGWYTVIEKINHPTRRSYYLYTVEFDEINGISYRTSVERKHVLSGGIKNPYYPLKLGVACVGNVNSKHYPKEFNKWRAMIERCYDTNNNHYSTYGAKGVKVCDRWLCFEYFLEDLPKVVGYDKDKLYEERGLYLDKDIRGNGLLYSIDNCILTTNTDNIAEMNRRVKQYQVKATRISDGYVEIFHNQTEFAEKLGLKNGNITKCLQGKQKTFGGYQLEKI
jgi:hypothetical protein